MRLRAILPVCFGALLLQAGCLLLPIPTSEDKVLAGTPVTEEQLAFLAPGVTTKSEVVDRLGEPDVIWEEARLFAYEWTVRQGILIWAVGAGYTGHAGATDLPKRYMLLVQFDERDRVQRFERAAWPSGQSHGRFLEQWVAGTVTKAQGTSGAPGAVRD